MPTLKRVSKLKTTILPDGYVAIFAGPADRAYTLPPLAALAWEFFDGEHSTEEIVTEVAKVVGTEETKELHDQIMDLSNELRKSGFLEDCLVKP